MIQYANSHELPSSSMQHLPEVDSKIHVGLLSFPELDIVLADTECQIKHQ